MKQIELSPLLWNAVNNGNYGETKEALRGVAKDHGINPRTFRLMWSRGVNGPVMLLVGEPGGPFDHTDMD